MRGIASVSTTMTLVALIGARAAAQPLPDAASIEQRAAASAAYKEGKTAYEAGDFAAAHEAFERSRATVRSPNTTLMVARSLRELARLGEAREAYERTIAEAEEVADPKYADAADAARAELAALPADSAPAEATEAEPEQAPALQAGFDTDLRDEGSATAEGDNPLERRAQTGLTVGAKVGGSIGAPVSDFGASYVLELELGWALPLGDPIGHSLGLFVSGQYTQPGLDGRIAEGDPRLSEDGSASYEVTQQLLGLSLAAIYRIPVGSDLVMPNLGAGGRMYLLETEVQGEASGASFGENAETRSAIGLLLLGGAELYVGPGALLAELSFSFASVDAFVLRDTAVGGLSLALGYRFVF